MTWRIMEAVKKMFLKARNNYHAWNDVGQGLVTPDLFWKKNT